jgi:membrane-anchored protein YejM (alkaline phosphatase superfamily)
LQESLTQLGHTQMSNTYVCTGPRQTIELLLDHVTKFVQRFSKDRYFAMFWSSTVSHNDLNMAHMADQLFARTLRQLTQNGMLENTVLLFISDHGIRFGEFRETFQVYDNENI